MELRTVLENKICIKCGWKDILLEIKRRLNLFRRHERTGKISWKERIWCGRNICCYRWCFIKTTKTLVNLFTSPGAKKASLTGSLIACGVWRILVWFKNSGRFCCCCSRTIKTKTKQFLKFFQPLLLSILIRIRQNV